MALARAEARSVVQVPNPVTVYSRTEDLPHQHLTVEQSLAWLATRGSQRQWGATTIARAKTDSLQRTAEIAREVRSAFFGAVAAARAHQIASELSATADSIARLGQRRYEQGDIAQLEYEQLVQEAGRQLQGLSVAREALQRSSAALVQALGLPGPPGPLSARLDDGLTDSLPASADSPFSVRLAEADSVLALQALHTRRQTALPIPSLQVGVEWDDPDRPGRALSVLGISIPLPIWNQGGSDLAIARAALDRARADLTEARSAAAREAMELKSRVLESAGRARFARDSLVPMARRLRQRAVTAYASGATGLLPVLDALRAEREVLLAEVNDLVVYQEARAAWLAFQGVVR
jgi:cobalt-zinc-cadmium efflux system outer membrane protein